MTALKYMVQILLFAALILLLMSLLNAAVEWVVKNCNFIWVYKCLVAIWAAALLVAFKIYLKD